MSPYPLRFDPIFTSNLWGGTRLPGFLRQPPPFEGPVGEAWVLSDVDGHSSRIRNGPHAGKTIRELIADHPDRILGRAKLDKGRFPLLFKFIDARQELSVQVHPDDERAATHRPGAVGKTEAWVILEANPATSRLYSGFKSGVTAESFKAALAEKTTPGTLHAFTPKPGDCVFLPAGIVHAIGADILLFEVQQTSDITYRLYDWDRVDAKTGLPRELHIEKGLAASDFASGPCPAVQPVQLDDGREQLVNCQYFTIHRRTTAKRFPIGGDGRCRVLAVLHADARSAIEWPDDVDGIATGDVLLLPAELGECTIIPAGPVTILECGLPE